jgi:peptide/nickel transport system ATP-binding protein
MTVHMRGFGVRIATRDRGGGIVAGLDGVDLDIESGAVTAVIGESGCGKSLVALALCGLLPPGSTVWGSLDIGGRSFAGADEKQWRGLRGHTVGLVPQSPSTSFTSVRTVGSQIAEVVDALDSDRSATELAALAGLPADALGLFPHQLSGGMAQRAAIAAALAGRPALLVADEPTSALDPELAAMVWKLLRSIADDGAAVLVITHEIKSLMSSDICDSLAVMRSGRVIAQGTPAHIREVADDHTGKLFVGVPR